jgi:hypothetical protein
VIYSHCDNGANTAWRRNNTIKWKYPQFEFDFSDIDFKDVPNDIDGFEELQKNIKNSVIKQGETPVTKETLAIKKIIEKKDGNYITYEELKQQTKITPEIIPSLKNQNFKYHQQWITRCTSFGWV